jgi:DNA-binding LacI/PurR family transcriptional regulator
MGDYRLSSLPLLGLSTVSDPLDTIGAKAGELLMDMINGKTVEPKVWTMDVDVVLRETTRAIAYSNSSFNVRISTRTKPAFHILRRYSF